MGLFKMPPMPPVKPLRGEGTYMVSYCGADHLAARLNSLDGEVISVTWQGVPHSRFVVVYKRITLMEIFRRNECKHKQGKHCIKLGSKCVDERWFTSGRCLMREYKGTPPMPKGVVPPPPVPPTPPESRMIIEDGCMPKRKGWCDNE